MASHCRGSVPKGGTSNQPYDYSTRRGIRPVSWESFHGICRALARATSRFGPQIVLAIGRGGYYPGTLIAHMLQVELYPIRLSRRVNDVVRYAHPRWLVEPPALVAGCRILIVDEICASGETLTMAADKVRSLGATEVRSAVMYAHTQGATVPDYIGLITDALLLNPWDREILCEGRFRFHPEYVQALAEQGMAPDQSLLVQAPHVELAKGG
ncbi:MAG: phosphoribosyltransferase [Anaerolineae bacterium]|nr:phosphoribosyltransferase [Anaerolineae bacterium]